MRLPRTSSRRRLQRKHGGSRIIGFSLLLLATAAALALVWHKEGPVPPASGIVTNRLADRFQPEPIPESQLPGEPKAVSTNRAPEPPELVPVSRPRLVSSTATAGVETNRGSASNNNGFMTSALPRPFDERLLSAQVALARRGISSGPVDGINGTQTRAALRAFQRKVGLPATGELNDATFAQLPLTGPLYTNVVVSATDLANLEPLGTTWLAKSQQDRLEYETALEMLAERTLSNPKLVRALNPQIEWNRFVAGATVKLVNIEIPPVDRKAAFLRILLADRLLQAFDESTNLLAHYPCSIAARVEKRPVGEALRIAVVAPNPNYTFDPEVFPESAEARELGRKLILQPGPNNPVGTVWIGLDKPGYGIHGTPIPEHVGRTESHGCFRLANWNAEHLLKLITLEMPVYVEP